MRPPDKSGQTLPSLVKMNGRHRPCLRFRKSDFCGFTLIELVIIIVVLGILGAFATAKYSDFVKQSRIEATKAEMGTIKRAIKGNPQITAGGKYTDIGYEGNMGSVPTRLQDLVTKPSGAPEYNKISGLGWNGPYIESKNGEYLTDAWGKPYVYDPTARTIKSVGSGQDIIASF